MTSRNHPPFRADHVGSFLRPAYLLEARDQFFKQKSITAEQLRLVEDRAITEIVKFQADVGLSPSPTVNSAAPISTSTFWSNSAA